MFSEQRNYCGIVKRSELRRAFRQVVRLKQLHLPTNVVSQSSNGCKIPGHLTPFSEPGVPVSTMRKVSASMLSYDAPLIAFPSDTFTV